MHFFNPAPVMKLVEVVRTVLTAQDTVSTALAAAAALGKRPVQCADRAGFIVNALLFPYLNRAVCMMREGVATADEIDTVMTAGHGFPMGPFKLLDVIGLDVSLAIQRTLHRAFREPALALPARWNSWWRRATWDARRDAASARTTPCDTAPTGPCPCPSLRGPPARGAPDAASPVVRPHTTGLRGRGPRGR